MLSTARQRLKRIIPARLLSPLLSERWWRALIEANEPNRPLATRILQACGNRVMAGPFRGLLYPVEPYLQHCSTHQLLGTYEEEVQPWLETLLSNHYQAGVVIGSGEGYYAVGLARRLAIAIDAYETSRSVREDCAQMARLNGVESLVRQHSWCSTGTLRNIAGARALIICDCEGYEKVLFTPETAPALANSDLLIELHGDAREPILRALRETHRTTIVGRSERDPKKFPHLAGLNYEDAVAAISEDVREPDQEWLIAISARYDSK